MPILGDKRTLVGKKFGRLTVLIEVVSPHKTRRWLCVCSCGKTAICYDSSLATGRSKSCGCYRDELRRKHNLSNTRIYMIWAGMLNRCYKSTNTRYADYGGRGIKVCKKWHLFVGFYEDMKLGYSEKLSLDRIRVNGNYCKSNCRWSTPKEQGRNRRNNVFLNINGKNKCISEWAELVGFERSLISTRLRRRWSIKDSVFGKRK